MQFFKQHRLTVFALLLLPLLQVSVNRRFLHHLPIYYRSNLLTQSWESDLLTSNGYRHILYFKLIDRFHAQLRECKQGRLLNGLGN